MSWRNRYIARFSAMITTAMAGLMSIILAITTWREQTSDSIQTQSVNWLPGFGGMMLLCVGLALMAVAFLLVPATDRAREYMRLQASAKKHMIPKRGS